MTSEWHYKGEKQDCKPLHYNWCGLDDVYLLSGYQVIPTEDGEDVVIEDMDGLHEAIGLHLARHKKALNGKEIRFLRHEMDLTQSELADLVAVTGQTVARWEKGEVPIPGSSELLLRFFYLSHVEKTVDIPAVVKELRAMDEASVPRQVFEETDQGWRARAA